MKTQIIALLCIFALCSVQNIRAESLDRNWQLPQELTDQNTSIRFEVDSTWHLVKGSASGVTGTVSHEDTVHPKAISLTLSVPVAKLDTNNSMRDRRLQEVMSAEKYPSITFQSSNINIICTPLKVDHDGTCSDSISGNLTILKTQKRVTIPITIMYGGHRGYLVTGQIPLRWVEYGVEDPSILVAHVDPVVTIFFSVTVQQQQKE